MNTKMCRFKSQEHPSAMSTTVNDILTNEDFEEIATSSGLTEDWAQDADAHATNLFDAEADRRDRDWGLIARQIVGRESLD